MSQIFTTHNIEKCEYCGEVKTEIGINSYVCFGCNNTEDNF